MNRDLIAGLLARLYPDRRWGAPSDEASFRQGVADREGRRLALRAAEALAVPAYFVPGAPDESCDYIWVLCVGREPPLLALREGGAPPACPTGGLADVYLRLALSALARMATVQEVAMDLVASHGGAVLRERPRAGVRDDTLLGRAGRLADLAEAAGITCIDFGRLAASPPGYDDGDYQGRYGQRPGTVNYLFFPQPATAVSTTFIPAAAESR